MARDERKERRWARFRGNTSNSKVTTVFDGKITVNAEGHASLNLKNEKVKKRLRKQLRDLKDVELDENPA